ncbi:uncharacterized protein LOC142227072 [Haematobia irritans]|uniref:uncharacterized protein LOC142227072 n=1 Tax=Haematobia irritans TaxID=7368 RepID=UPI003F5098C4
MAQLVKKPRCFLCGRNQPLKYCVRFRNMSVPERRKVLVGKDICINCFGSGHTRSNCPSENRCQMCDAKHHTMIHVDNFEAVPSFETTILWSSDNEETDQFTATTPCSGNETNFFTITADELSSLPFDSMPFYKQMTTYKGCLPYNWSPTDDNKSTMIAPVIECDVLEGGIQKSLTFLFEPRVPKSMLVFESIKEFGHVCSTRLDINYGLFNIILPYEQHRHRFVIVNRIPFYTPPAVKRSFASYFPHRQMAHPNPFDYSHIDGVFGHDLEDYIVLGESSKCEKNPCISIQNTVFGLVLSGSTARSNIPFLKSLAPLERREDGPFCN